MPSSYVKWPPQQLPVYDSFANLPAGQPGGSQAVVYLTPTTHQVYIYDSGSATWVLVADGASVGGTVTSVSVVTANGFAGTVATATTTPAITLSTTITGLLQGNGTAISAYTGGNLTDVGTDGITITGGAGAVIGAGTSIAQHVADSTHNGYLSSTDWTTFNGKGTGSVTSVAMSVPAIMSVAGSPITTSGTLAVTLATQLANLVWAGPTSGGAAAPTFRSLVAADLPAGTGTVTSVAMSVPAFLSVAGSPITTSGTLAVSLSGTALPVLNGGTGVTSLGNFTDAGTDGITVTGGTGAVITSMSISQRVADSTHNGYLSSTDWTTFNGKQATGNYITALTGDVTASGPGSVAATLATVNGNVGSFGSSTSIPTFTVNAKGLITAASGNVVIAPAGTLTGATLAAGVTASSLTSVGTIATGIWQGTAVDATHGGTAQTTYASGDILYASAANTLSKLPKGSDTQVLTLASGLPTWAAATGAAINYYSGTMSDAPTWTTTSTSYADPGNSGGNTLTQLQASGLTVTAAASNLPGITFTPSSSSAVYLVSAVVQIFYNSNAAFTGGIRLTDGTNVIANAAINPGAVRVTPTLVGLFVPGTGSAVTLKLQLKTTNASGTATLTSTLSGDPSITWTIVQLKA